MLLLGVPLVLWRWLPPMAILPVLWGMALLCHAISRAVTHESTRRFWNWQAVNRRNLARMGLRFVLCAALLSALTAALKPELLGNFVRERPQLWAVVMVVYPLLSVVPQEIVFRSYLFARFSGRLLPPVAMLLVSGLGFGFAHIVFGNWVAPTLCAIGGLLFAQTYQRTRSLALVAIEHALFGDFIFTLGLGRYFYHGAVGH